MTDLDALLKLAVDIAAEAGELVRERRDAVTRMAVSATKSTPTDIVTESDTAAEALIRDRLGAARPDDAVLGEEGGASAGKSGIRWVVDPIDGTVNYLYGLPQYAVSIAAQQNDGDIVVGVVHNPVSRETWTAVRGGGAYLDGDAIHESGCADLNLALVATGFGYDAARRQRQAAIVAGILPSIRDIRRAGAASLDLCSVATGRLDAYFERGLGPWDLAAGGLIAEEAGAVVAGLRGAAAGQDLVIDAGPAWFEPLHDLLAPLRPDQDA